MGYPISRLLAMLVMLAVFVPASLVRGQEDVVEPLPVEAPPPPRRPDSPSITFEVSDVPGVWDAMRHTRLRQNIEAIFQLPFVADDDGIAALRVGLGSIAERGGVAPTLDSLVGENTRSAHLVLFRDEEVEDPSQVPFILNLTMTTAELAQAASDVLNANLSGGDLEIRAFGEMLLITNAPIRMIQDRMADWRSPRIFEALQLSELEGAQVRFFAQPARDKQPGGGDKISGGHIRFQPHRIDIAMDALPAREDGALRVPAADGLRPLDGLVTLAETPHVLALAYHGAATMLDKASRDGTQSRGRFIASGLESYTGASTADLVAAFGEDAMLGLNTLAIRGMFDFTLGVTAAWEVRDHAKAVGILDTLKETHQANLRRDAESYGRSVDGLRFREGEHRGIATWSAPLMIFPIQPSSPPTLNIALTEDFLFFATSHSSLTSLLDRRLDGTSDTTLLDQARSGHELPAEVHSLGTADFGVFAEVFRRALPVIIAFTQGGQESQVFGRAFADVIGALGQGTATGIYNPDGQSVRAAILLPAPNPAP